MAETNLSVDTDTDSEEAPARFTTKRLVRWAAILSVGIFVVLAIWQDPLYAIHH